MPLPVLTLKYSPYKNFPEPGQIFHGKNDVYIFIVQCMMVPSKFGVVNV